MPIPGTVQVTGPIAPTATSDTFGTHYDIYGIGGLRVVADHATRNGLIAPRAVLDMIVITQNDGFLWQLTTFPPTGSDSDWTQFTGGGGGITQLTGDVTAGPGSGSQVATIAGHAVTYAKMQNVSANSVLLGSGASGSGAAPVEIALGTNLSMSGTTLNAAGGSVPAVTFNKQTVSYTLVLADVSLSTPTMVQMNLAGANTLTVAKNSTTAYPIGVAVGWQQYGAGQTTLTPASGVTFRTSGSLTSRTQYSSGTMIQLATDEWLIEGDTS